MTDPEALELGRELAELCGVSPLAMQDSEAISLGRIAVKLSERHVLENVDVRTSTMTEVISRALLVASGENPDHYHTKESRESGLALCDHAIPLWRQSDFYGTAKKVTQAMIDARLRELGD